MVLKSFQRDFYPCSNSNKTGQTPCQPRCVWQGWVLPSREAEDKGVGHFLRYPQRCAQWVPCPLRGDLARPVCAVPLPQLCLHVVRPFPRGMSSPRGIPGYFISSTGKGEIKHPGLAMWRCCLLSLLAMGNRMVRLTSAGWTAYQIDSSAACRFS